jgi:glycerol-3-phosphate dehydrogenase (NAD(P)+)
MSDISKDIGIIGAGAWGCAVAKCLAEAGHRVHIWAYEAEVCEDINVRHQNTRYLPDIELSPLITASTDLHAVAGGKRFLIFATPSLFTLPAVKKLITLPDILEGRTIIGVITKGFVTTPRGPRMMLQAMEDYLPGSYKDSLVYISGPSHAEEVARGKLTGLIAASRNPLNSVRFRNLLNTHPLMVFSSTDIIGVQVSAAAKNVVAIAFGMMDAIKETSPVIGDNTESLLLAAGLNEIQTLAAALGSTHPSKTLTSIAGVGDLDVTCRSIHGRNRRFGREVVNKNLLDGFNNIGEVIAGFSKIGYLAEGVVAVTYIKDYAQQYKLKMPICASVYRILNKESLPADEIQGFLRTLANSKHLNTHISQIRVR